MKRKVLTTLALLILASISYEQQTRKLPKMNSVVLIITAGEALSAGDAVVLYPTDGKYYKSGTHNYSWDAISTQDLAVDEIGQAVSLGVVTVPAPETNIDVHMPIYVILTTGGLTRQDKDNCALAGYALTATTVVGESLQVMVQQGTQAVQFHDFYPPHNLIANNHLWNTKLIDGVANSIYAIAVLPAGARAISGGPRVKIYYSSDIAGGNFDYGITLRFQDPFGNVTSTSWIGTTPAPGTANVLQVLTLDITGYSSMFRHWTNMTIEIHRFGASGADTATGIWLIQNVEIVF